SVFLEAEHAEVESALEDALGRDMLSHAFRTAADDAEVPLGNDAAARRQCVKRQPIDGMGLVQGMEERPPESFGVRLLLQVDEALVVGKTEVLELLDLRGSALDALSRCRGRDAPVLQSLAEVGRQRRTRLTQQRLKQGS